MSNEQAPKPVLLPLVRKLAGRVGALDSCGLNLRAAKNATLLRLWLPHIPEVLNCARLQTVASRFV